MGTPLRDVMAAQGPHLRRFVRGLTGHDHQLAEDVVQDTFVRAWRHLDALPESEQELRRWLFTVARRLVIDDVRRRRVRPVADGDTVQTRAAGDDPAASAVARLALREAVGRLSAAQREVLSEIYFADRSIPEVARRLEIAEGTVRSRVHYALRTLRLAVTADDPAGPRPRR